jgi:hypothetical protein
VPPPEQAVVCPFAASQVSRCVRRRRRAETRPSTPGTYSMRKRPGQLPYSWPQPSARRCRGPVSVCSFSPAAAPSPRRPGLASPLANRQVLHALGKRGRGRGRCRCRCHRCGSFVEGVAVLSTSPSISQHVPESVRGTNPKYISGQAETTDASILQNTDCTWSW